MALPTSYLTSTKNLQAILQAIQQAKAPERFTQRFLEELDFKSTSDRLVIGVLKTLRFIDDQGRPTERYFQYLDQSQSGRVMAEGVREAYDDLFKINTTAHKLSRHDIINKFKTLSQGAFSEAVLDKMALTFSALTNLADFDASPLAAQPKFIELDPASPPKPISDTIVDNNPLLGAPRDKKHTLGGLHYNIQIILPESRDPKVYDALFSSLREHLL
jgi:hypothetical protein